MQTKDSKPRITLRAHAQSPQPNENAISKTQQAFKDGQVISTHVHQMGDTIALIQGLSEHGFYRVKKKQISIRFDEDVLAWFKNQPGKYQKRINQVCRAHMLANLTNHNPDQNHTPEPIPQGTVTSG